MIVRDCFRNVFVICGVWLWGMGIGSVVAEPPITALRLTPDKKSLIAGSQRGLEVLQRQDLSVSQRLETELEHIHDLQFSSDGKWLVVLGGMPSVHGAIELWSWEDKKRVAVLHHSDDLIYSSAWMVGSDQIAVASGDGVCTIHRCPDLGISGTFGGHSGAVVSLRALSDNRIVSAGFDQTIRIWESKSGTSVRELDNHTDMVNDLVVIAPSEQFPKQRLYSCGQDKTVRLWDPETGRLVRFQRLAATPRCMAWDQVKSRLLVACDDKVVRVLSADSLVVLQEYASKIERVFEIVIDSEARQAYVAGAGGIAAFKLEESE
ncbi:WD40 repeat domain-containing protein [Pirellulaceae bacterium SH449]